VGTPLDQWQKKLEAHFRALAHKRANSGFHIFALEHGLADPELDEIGTLLRARLRSSERLYPHWLAWVVYAAELGYRYNGEEYWQSFEEQTPFWAGPYRYSLAGWFKKFQQQFDGVVPTGPWASHFRIIAWPITHAILPRYLQRQFARALYDLRHRLAALAHLEAAAVGRLFAVHAHASSRFEEFLQQEELTGRIVLALLGETPAGTTDPISPSTLNRIVSDLDEVRHGSEWLREARRVVRARFTGIGSGSGPAAARTPVSSGVSTSDAPRPTIRPNVLLRASGAGNWSVVLEVPDFGCTALNASVRDFLRSTRSYIAGGEAPRPAGWLLGGTRIAVLKSWPPPKAPLIHFEQRHAVVDHLVNSDCLMSEGPIWLFRIGAGGLAREITGRIVRPGIDYIITTIATLPETCDWINECEIDCSGVRACRMRVPASLSEHDEARIKRIGLQVARTIRVWPAGLPGRAWDGEGSSEWLTTEAPCFGMVHDHVIQAFILRLNDGPETLIEAGVVGFSSYVRLPPLPAGQHYLSVEARRSSPPRDASPDAEGHLILSVREPEAWRPGRAFHSGLIVTLDPPDADLDALWENRISVSIVGPEGHHVHCELSLAKGDGTEILREQVGDTMSLPVTPELWSKQLAKMVDHEDCALGYLEATSGCLTIKADELGEFRMLFERNLPPVRWAMRRNGGSITVRLIDDAGQEGCEPRNLTRNMERPLAATEISPDHAHAGVEVPLPGSLFVAQLDSYRDAVVVSADPSGTGLQGLGIAPTFAELDDGSVGSADACRILTLWSEARLAGFLPDARRLQLTDGLACAIYKHLCGWHWARAERAYLAAPRSDNAIDGLRHSVHNRAAFAIVLRRDYQRMEDDFDRASAWYADLARRYDICAEQNVCDAALRLAAAPHRFSQMAGDELDSMLDVLRESPAVLRGARMLALLSANDGNAGPARLFPRWGL